MGQQPLDLLSAFPDTVPPVDEVPAPEPAPVGALDLTSAFPDLTDETTDEDMLQQSLLGASRTTPDQHASDLKMSETSGLPVDYVGRNRNKVGVDIRRDSIKEAAKGRPGLTGFMTDQDNAAVASDDYENLAALEDSFASGLVGYSGTYDTFKKALTDESLGLARGTLRGTAKGAISILGQMPYNIIGGIFGSMEEAAKGFEQLLQPMTEGTVYEERGGAFGAIRDWALNNSQILQDSVIESDLLALPDEKRVPLIDKPELILDPEWLSDNIAQAGANVAAMVGTAAATGGGAEAAAFLGGAAEGGSLYQELIEDGVDGATAIEASMLFGYLVTRFEKIGADRWLGKERVKSMGSRIAKSLVSGSTEAVSEWAEEPTQAFIGSLAKGEDIHTATDNAIEASKNIDVMVGAFAAGGGMAFAGKYRSEHKMSERVAQNQAFFQDVNSKVEASALKKRAPERFKAYAQSIVETGNAPDHVYVPVDQVERVAGELDLNVGELLNEAGVEDQYAGAAAVGGDIAFPMADFISTIAGTEVGIGLEQDFRFDPYEMTPREMAEFSQTSFDLFGADMQAAQQAAESVIAEDEELVQLKDNIRNSLASVGMAYEEAEANAEIWTARAQVAAQDYSAAGIPTTATEWVQNRSLVFADDVTGKKIDLSQVIGAGITPEQVATSFSQDDVDVVAGSEESLAQAKQLLDSGAEMMDVYRQTRWARNLKGEWKYFAPKEEQAPVAPPMPAASQKEDDYRGMHTAPGPEEGAPAHDLSGESGIYPDDIYSEKATSLYGTGNPSMDSASIEVIRGMRGKESAKVAIYRAVPTGVDVSNINPGDWVTINRDYAVEHGDSNLGGDYTIIESTVPASSLYTDGNSIHEWGYWPESSLTLYQEQTPDLRSDGRGFVSFADNKTIITLFERSDASTFLHESAHIFYQDMLDLAAQPDAPQRLKDDVKAINEFAKRNTEQVYLDALNVAMKAARRGDITKEELAEVRRLKISQIVEMIDSGVEGDGAQQFVFVARHEMFARSFESYLREGKAPSLELESAFRRFKRWLTRIYKSVRDLRIKIDDDLRGVMNRVLATDEMLSQLEMANNSAPVFLTAEEAGMTEEQFAAYREIGEEARGKAREIMLKKLMKRISRRNKEWYKEERKRTEGDIRNGLLSAREYRAWHYLSKGYMPDESPDNAVANHAKINSKILKEEYGAATYQEVGKLRPFVFNKEGLHPDVLATELGFSSGDELVQALATMKPLKQAVAEATDAAMDEYESLLTDEGVQEEAELALNNEARIELLLTEQDIANRKAAGERARAESMRMARERAKSIREAAKLAIAQQRSTDASKIAVHQRAERSAARDAIAAAQKGDNAALADAKARQAMAAAMAYEAMNAKQETEQIRKYLTKFNKPGVRKNIARDNLDAIDTILERFDFRKSVTNAQIEGRESLAEWITKQRDLGFEPDIPPMVEREAFSVSYKKMTLEQLQSVRDAVRSIETIGRRKEEVMTARKKRLFSESVSELVDETIENFGDNLSPAKVVRSVAKKKSMLKSLDAQMSKVEFICLALDGGKLNGKWWDAIYRPVNDGVNKKMERFLEVRDRLYGPEMFGRYDEKELTRFGYKKIFIEEIGDSLTKEEILAVALNRGNAYNWSALLEGEAWSESQGEAVLSQLDARDWEVVENIWQLVDSFWPDVKAMYRRLSGNPPKKVDATPFENPLGREMRGGYYPLVADRDLSVRAAQREDSRNVKEMFGGNGMRPTTRNGHAKERTDFGGQAVSLSLDVLVRHIDQVTHDIYLREAVIDTDRYFQDKRVQNIITRALGREQYDQLRPWLASVAGQKPYGYDDVQKIARFFRSNATYAMMGWKATVALSQYAGLLNVVPYLPGKTSVASGRLFNNLVRIIKPGGKKLGDEVSARSLELKDRRHNFTQEVQNLSNNLGFGKKVSAWKEALMYFTGLADYHVTHAAWLTSYDMSIEEGMTEQEAIDRADSVIRLSQGSGKEKDLAALQRGTEWQKMWTMFFSYMNTNYNQIATSYKGFRTGKSKAKFIGECAFFWFMPVIAAELLSGRGPDDDDDEGWIEWGAKKIAMHATGFVPGVRDIVRMVEDDYGRPVSLFGRVGASVRKLGVKIAQDDLDAEETFWQAVDTAGYFVPFPSGQARITMRQFIEWMNGERDELSLLFHQKR